MKYCANETNIKVALMSAQVHIPFITFQCEYMYEYVIKMFTDFLQYFATYFMFFIVLVIILFIKFLLFGIICV